MENKFIKLNTIKKIKDFVRLCEQCATPIEVRRGRWCVDGASLMGVMSLDLSEGAIIIYDKGADTTKLINWLNANSDAE